MNEDTYLKSTSFIAFTVLHTCYRNSLIKITPKILIDELKSGVQALLAQWIARWTSNPKVVGSSPTQGIFLYFEVGLSWKNFIYSVRMYRTRHHFMEFSYRSRDVRREWRHHDVIKSVSFKVDKRIKQIWSLLVCLVRHTVHNVVLKRYWNPKFRRN